MLDDVVREERALIEMLVSTRLKYVEAEIDGLKRGLEALAHVLEDNVGKPLLSTVKSAQDSAVSRYANTLKEWSGKTTANVIYDSSVCSFNDNCLFQMVKDKPNVAIITTTADGDVFGGFFSVPVTVQNVEFEDPNMFIFSFESHGRCETPQRFFPNEETKDNAFVEFYQRDSFGRFVLFSGGVEAFSLGNEKSKTFSFNLSDAFDGIENNTLSGKGNYEKYTCNGLIAIQLK